MNEHAAERDVPRLALNESLLTEADAEVMRRWFAGEATEAEMTAVVQRNFYAQMPDLGCPTEGCKGDPRYAAPGRGHLEDCTYPTETGYVLPPGSGRTGADS